ncbi:MAG TPA: RimJ/RimL family protein N-acetyltransferase, partial [Bdellovibrionota bacterium]|nr:RimJ/RimL family protein N-acetyltransferase [Bdellovibrionota bacterium]
MFRLDLGSSTILEQIGTKDAPEVFAVVDRNRDRLREWLPWLDRNRSEADSLAFIRGAVAAHEANQGVTAIIRS